MKKFSLFFLLLFSAPILPQEYPITHLGTTFFTETGYSGYGIHYKERDFNPLSISYELGANILTYETKGLDENSNANLTFAIGPYFNLDLGDDFFMMPYVGAVGGLGYLFRDETLNEYASDLQELSNKVEAEEDLPPDGAFFYWNATIGMELFIFGRADYGHAGINIAYSIGKFNTISAGFTFDFGIL